MSPVTAGRKPADPGRSTRAGPARGSPRVYRRRRLVAVAIMLLVVLGGAAGGGRYLLVGSGLLVVQDVQVRGAGTVSVADVLAAAAIERGTPLATLDLGSISARIAAVPGVATAEAARNWPSTVELTITERTPVAVAVVDGRLALVDATGVAYGAAPDPAPPLPRFTMARVAPEDPATVAALAVLAAVPASLRPQVVEVDADQPSAVILRLTGNRQVRWGSVEGSQRKAALLPPLLTRPGVSYDLMSPELPTVR